MNNKELNVLVTQYSNGLISGIEFLLMVQVSDTAMQNLLVASKLPAAALAKINIGDLMHTDDQKIRMDHEAAYNAAYLAKWQKIAIGARLVSIEVSTREAGRDEDSRFVYFKFATKGDSVDFFESIKDRCEAFKKPTANDVNPFKYQANWVVRVSFSVLTQIGMPYQSPSAVPASQEEIDPIVFYSATYRAQWHAKLEKDKVDASIIDVGFVKRGRNTNAIFHFAISGQAMKFISWIRDECEESNTDVWKLTRKLSYFSRDGGITFSVEVNHIVLEEVKMPYKPPKGKNEKEKKA